jgi:signal transduction histidine kinase
VTLRPWLDEIICLFAHQAETKGLDLRCQVASGVPVAVEADANRLRQILVNLIGNALKFTHRGHVTLRANARREHAGVARVDFVVEDSGPGIASADLARLFEPYSQLDTGGLEIVGTGLGLAIARRLAEQMGGEIRVKSRLGQGSTFRVTVPLKPVESEAASEPPRRRPPASMPASVIPVDGSRPTTDRTSHVAHPRS